MAYSSNGQQNDWENPEMIGYNKLPAQIGRAHV